MYYTIYQTTNIVNQKVYIGSHKTKDLNDNYLGSGKLLQIAIKKYGQDSFKKNILFIFDNEQDMYKKEKEIVNEEFISRKDTYNIKIGGWGGWDHVDNTGRLLSEESREKMSKSAKIRQTGKTNSFYGKKHKKDSLEKISKTSKSRAKEQYEQRIKKGNHPNNIGNCPVCGKSGQLRAMKRWHFDNCPKKIYS